MALTSVNQNSNAYLGVAVTLLMLALGALASFGFLGIGRGGSTYAFDMSYIHVAGEMWENGLSPYDAASFKMHMKTIAGMDSEIFAYPPNASPLAMILAIGDLGSAKIAMGGLNIAALLFLVAFIYGGALRTTEADPIARARLPADVLVASAMVIGNPFTAHVVWMGQTTLIASALLVGCWLMADRRSDILAGVLLGISAFKPQLAFLVGFWFLLDRRWSLVLTAALTTVVVSSWPILTSGLEGSWLAWLRSLGTYRDSGFNTASFKHVFGLRSVLASAGVETPSLMPLAAACVFLLYLARAGYDNIWLVMAILFISFLLFMAHDYDVAPAAILTYPLLRAARGKPALLAVIAVLAFVIFFPQRIWERLDMGGLARSREIALLGVLGIYLVICRLPQPATTARRASDPA